MAHYGYTKEGKDLKTQWETILNFVKEGHRITQWQAYEEFGFTDLAGIVKKIHYHTGIFLKRRNLEKTTRYGGKTLITEYWYDADCGEWGDKR